MAAATAKKVKAAAAKPTEWYAGKAPSPYGSHSSMILKEWTEKVTDPDFVILEGDYGPYATKKKNLDNRCADPYRFATGPQRGSLLRQLLPDAKVVVQDEKVQLLP